MSEVHSFRVTASGAGGHGATAGSAGNVLLAVARLAGDLGAVVDGLSHDGTDCACSAGMLHARHRAERRAASTATLRGTLRTFTPEHAEVAVARLRQACVEAADAFGCAVALELADHAPAVVNDAAVTDVVRAAARRARRRRECARRPPGHPERRRDRVHEPRARAATSSSVLVGSTGRAARTTAPRSRSMRGASPSRRRSLATAAVDARGADAR